MLSNRTRAANGVGVCRFNADETSCVMASDPCLWCRPSKRGNASCLGLEMCVLRKNNNKSMCAGDVVSSPWWVPSESWCGVSSPGDGTLTSPRDVCVLNEGGAFAALLIGVIVTFVCVLRRSRREPEWAVISHSVVPPSPPRIHTSPAGIRCREQGRALSIDGDESVCDDFDSDGAMMDTDIPGLSFLGLDHYSPENNRTRWWTCASACFRFRTGCLLARHRSVCWGRCPCALVSCLIGSVLVGGVVVSEVVGIHTTDVSICRGEWWIIMSWCVPAAFTTILILGRACVCCEAFFYRKDNDHHVRFESAMFVGGARPYSRQWEGSESQDFDLL
jgi:hypothetical protein